RALEEAHSLEVRAVYDPARARAEPAAQALGCALAGVGVELAERDDVEALVLVGGPWFGLWPLEGATRLNKPAFCAAVPGPEDTERLAGARVLMATSPRLTLLLDRLGELVRGPLGQALLLTALARPGGRAGRPSSQTLLPLVLGCAALFGAEPTAVRRDGAALGLCGATLEFGPGRLAQGQGWTGGGPPGGPGCGGAPRGRATAELPGRLAWDDGAGRHTLEPHGGPAEAVLLERFARSVRDGEELRPGPEEVRRALGWLD